MKDAGKQQTVKYVKSNDFGTSFATGVYGGVVLNGTISMNFYVDRLPIPDDAKYIEKDGRLEVINPDDAGEFVLGIREVTNCTLMELNTAKAFREWLDIKIKEIEGAIDNQKKDGNK